MSAVCPPHAILVFLGGGLGALARLWLTSVMLSLMPASPWPWGTFCVNLLGSFLIGLLAALWGVLPVTQSWRLFLITGLLGGFTTFSALSLEALNLWRSQGALWAVGYGMGSVMLGVCLAGFGFWLGKMLASLA
ncbi:MAG: fluoride efflux transporter CrcB [Vampirovibrionales bacterium]|nr:fluoride efflux transporter CrcB [Vampirovibrionales bacterium]